MKKNVEKRIAAIAMVLIMSVVFVGCDISIDPVTVADEITVDREPDFSKSICGPTSDLQYINQYDGTLGVSIDFVNTYEAAVGALESPSYSKFCTGTLIGRNLFLTANHCIDSGTTSDFVAFNYEYSASGSSLTQDHYRITKVLEAGLGGLDYAILELEGNPGDKYGWTKVKAATPAVGETLVIIQHPAGRRKSIEAGPFNSVSGSYFTYVDLDTEGGSSGSGVLDLSGSIVAVHTNGGCTSTGGNNRGVRITKIMEYSPIIKSLVTNEPIPTPTITNTPTITPTVDPTANTWDAAAVYITGNRVVYNGYIWEAQWWTQGDQPGADQWGPWKKIGPIGPVTPVPTPTNTATPVATATAGTTPVVTPTPTATATTGTGPAAWAAGVDYAAGDLVTYSGVVYSCRQPHISLVGWEPPNVAALWSAQ